MKISLIIAAYNVEKHIEKCIASCVQQNIPITQFEIVVVNDGSTDATGKLLDKLELKIPNLKVVHKKNKGLGACRNTGLQHSTGEYVWFIDGDDYIQENCLQKIITTINHQQLEILVLNYAVVTSAHKTITRNANAIINGEKVQTGGAFYANNFSKSYSFLFIVSRKLFEDYDIKFMKRINMQDSEIVPKLLLNCKRLFFFDNVCYYYVQHINSFTNTSNGEKRHQYFKSIIKVRNSLTLLLTTLTDEQRDLAKGVELKIVSLHEVVFNHLIFFKYKRQWFIKILQLLKENELYPLQFKATGKLKIVKFGLNNFPVLTKIGIDIIRKK